MKQWVIIDDCMSSKSAQFEQPINAKDAQEAEHIARMEWAALTKEDQQKRDAYYVGYAEIDEDGCVVLDTMTDVVAVK